jgi:hypothetical protein
MLQKKSHILWLFIVMFLLSACAAKPEATVDAFLKDFRNSRTQQTLELSKYIINSGESLDLTLFGSDFNDIDDEGFSDEMSTLLLDQLYGFDYTIHSSVTSDDLARVSITLRAYPLRDNFIAFLQAYLPNAFAWAFEGISEEELRSRINTMFKETFEASEKTYVNTVEVHLKKVDNAWLISDSNSNDAFFDALLGGLYGFSLDE